MLLIKFIQKENWAVLAQQAGRVAGLGHGDDGRSVDVLCGQAGSVCGSVADADLAGGIGQAVVAVVAKSVLKKKPDSSLAIGFKLLNDGEGDAFVSAGNTGAITVGATLLTKRIKGVKRPAIASVMPSAKKPFVLMDCGANAECRPEFLYQFGLLGSIYMQNVLKVSNPRVALANNGTEETKGTPVVKEAYALMKSAPYNFVGNIEGRQIPFGDADVVVADGFTGNLILKMYEGVAKVLMNSIKAAFMKNTLSKISYLGVKSGIDDMKKQFDYKEYGGAVVLGVKKPVIKAHGSADARTFKNAIKQAVWFLQTDLIDKIEKELND